MQYDSLSLENIFEDVRDYYEAAAEERGVKITCEGKGKIHADSFMLRLALNNLVSNALKYTSLNGSILISTKRNTEETCITICDTGEGISSDHLSRLFDRFYRVDSARSLKTGGTGLGLAIVKSIMDLHKGQIHVSSQLGSGTAVILTFPN